jgi:ABC-type sugar transport system ATPase subunit
MMPVVVGMKDVAKSFGQTKALKGVSVEIAAGSVHGLIGPNGSGKSTLIRVMTGLQRPDDGTIAIDGVAHRNITPKQARGFGLELVPQELALVPLFKVWENIVLGDEPGGFRLSKSAGREVARQVLDELGLDIGVDEDTFMLDPGEQRLVMFARTFHRKARLMIADEPTAGLGEKESRTVLDALRKLNATGVTILFVSHHLSEVVEICGEVTAMRDGSVSAHLVGGDLTEHRLVREMTGDVEREPVRSREQPRSKVIVEGRHLAMPPLRQLNFKLYENERLGFAGLLGSGRENVVNVISGAARLWGSVRIKGEFIETPRDAILNGLGILSGNRQLSIIPGWNLVKHVSLPRVGLWSRLGFIDRRQEHAAAQVALRQLHVAAGLDHELADLSGGNQQRALMSRWLMCGSHILLIDEPCVGVDIGARAELIAAIRAFGETNAVVVASSDPLDLVESCDRVLCLRKGVVVKELVGDEITEEAIVRAIMTVDKSQNGEMRAA